MFKGDREAGQSESIVDQLRIAIPEVIRSKKRELEEEFGDASDYGIQGALVLKDELVVGDAGIIAISTQPGYEHDFVDNLQGRTEGLIDFSGTVLVSKDQELTHEYLVQQLQEIGYSSNTPYTMILG